MWNAFGNGPGLQGGGGGYVGKAQGWEFVPCSRLERERGRGKSPLRTLSPSIPVGHFYEQPIPGLGVAGASESSRGQVPRNELQTQHTRMKKKIEDLKKRHGQDKEEWMREKEVLLRQMADIQGGENRRILLDLKSILDEVQLEVKREETKRSDLQLQYMKDRCAWELERAELKCRIAQLEVREHVSPAEAPVAKTSEQPVSSGGGSTLWREQLEQKRLLADTHTVAMDLRCRMEHSERGWLRERSELLERFDLERKEWESQLRDMQKKIEELYNEVRSHREPDDVGLTAEAHSSTCFSVQSASTGSSVLTDPSDAHSSSYSDSTHWHSKRPGGGGGDLSGRLSNSHNSGSRANSRGDGAIRSGTNSEAKADQHVTTSVERQEISMGIDTAELEDILQGCLGPKLDRHPSLVGQEELLNPFSDLQSMDIRCGTDKRNTIALNAALKEIARVSEELCSYQDEIKRKSDGKRSHTESLYFPDELERIENERNKLEMDETFFSLNQWCKELQGIDEQCWIHPTVTLKETNMIEPEISIPLMKSPEAPPVPPRSTSWYMNSPPPPLEPEFTIPESRVDRKCPSPCVHLDKKCNSPSVVRKFEAMLQENEGKILTDSGIIPCVVPADSKCNISCCHSRWSCDGSRFGSSKSSTYVPVQKCLSELNIPSTGADYHQDHKAAGTPKSPREPLCPLSSNIPGKESHGDIRLSTLDILPTQGGSLAPRRNMTLEQKTAKFNRTLFQAEMGRGFEDQDELSPADMTPSPTLQQQSKVRLREVNADIMPPPHDLEVKPKDGPTPSECHRDLKHSKVRYAEMELEKAMFQLPVQCHEASVKQVVSELVPQHPVVRVRDTIHPSTRNPPETKPRSTAFDLQPEGVHEREVSSKQTVTTMAQLGVSVTVTPILSRNKVELASGPRAGPAQRPSETKPKMVESAMSDVPKTRSRILNENPWKPTTLAAYPRPVDSRSNYGAIERILKSYECSPTQTPAAAVAPSPGKEDDLIELMDMLNVEHHARSGQRLTHTTQRQATTHKETHVTVQKSKESGVTSRKSFSRPACPANRRLPSRWASRSPSASSTSSSSTSSSPVTQLSVSTQKQTFSYAAFHTETVII